MKLRAVSLLSVVLTLLASASVVHAVEFTGYDNLSTLSSLGPDYLFALPNGFTQADDNGGLTTSLVADDIRVVGAQQPYRLTRFSFYVTNSNTAAVTVRPRVRLWDDDRLVQIGGRDTDIPGGLFGAYDLNPIRLPAASSGSFRRVRVDYVIAGGGVLVPSGATGNPNRFWAGVVFDNDGGTTGATKAQLDNVGQLVNDIYNEENHVITGFSGDVLFGTDDVPFRQNGSPNPFYGTPDGDGFARSNPPGSIFDVTNFPAAPGLTQPYANVAWSFNVVNVGQAPEPGTLALMGVALSVGGGSAFLRRRKS